MATVGGGCSLPTPRPLTPGRPCTHTQVALVEQLVDEVWGGPWALALNPGWWGSADGGGAPPPQYAPLVDSWEAAYSLTITATQVRRQRREVVRGGAWRHSHSSVAG
jgi:hypothetical protein